MARIGHRRVEAIRGQAICSEEQIKEGLSRTELYKDMPRGRKRAGWKKEFLETISEAAKDLGELSNEEIQRAIRTYREERRVTKITVTAEV